MAYATEAERILGTTFGRNVFPIDLPTALALADVNNPQIALAREQVRQATARVDAADALWLPSLRIGANYNKHEGAIQNIDGTVFDDSRAAFNTGAGVGTAGAQSPPFPGLYANFRLGDALFQPLAARQFARSQRLAATAARNNTSLDAALGYLELMRAVQGIAVNENVLGHDQELAKIINAYARTGQGLLSDAERVQADLVVRQISVARSREDAHVASSRLAQVLRLDPTLVLVPIEPAILPIALVPEGTPLAELVSQGLMNRPELAQHRALVAAAVERLKQERYASTLPTIVMGTSYTGFGGDMGRQISNFGDRFDADIIAFWNVRNLGKGERAERDVARSDVRQADIRRVAVMDRIGREVAEASVRVHARRQQIELAKVGLRAARDSLRLNFERIKAAQGLPIEVLQSIQALALAEQEYLRTVIDYNAAQFSLHWALGQPAAAAVRSAAAQGGGHPARP
ncbi:MAG: TolC family protein [Planctomycetia bacterium]|nr:TolC family protein [Planctomycetia bacterium]